MASRRKEVTPYVYYEWRFTPKSISFEKWSSLWQAEKGE
jgi:hypothetical protein